MQKSIATSVLILSLAACSAGGLGTSKSEPDPYAPAIDPNGTAVDGLVVGHRLMAAGQHDLALKNFTRAAGEKGLTGEVLVALGSANLALGRLGQSEQILRKVVEKEPDWPEGWNNLGVVLMEKGDVAEASQVFQRAFALDNGESDSIRDNLRLALAKVENSVYGVDTEQDYKLVRRGSSEFLIRRLPG